MHFVKIEILIYIYGDIYLNITYFKLFLYIGNEICKNEDIDLNNI